MPATPPPEPQTPSSGSPTRLNGWKDIATYLDRGVRTVQRWEKEFNLPVRRLGPRRGESVFAFARELDAWQATPGADRARKASPSAECDGAEVDAATVDSPAFGQTTATSNRRWKAAVIFLATVVVLLGVWGTWPTGRLPDQRSPAPGAAAEPAALAIDLDTLVVSDARQQVLWRHRFPFTLDATQYDSKTSPFGAFSGIDDIDEDGRREVWVVSMPAEAVVAGGRELHVFDAAGKPEWTYRFTGEATFGQTRFPSPWPVGRVFMTADPAGGAGRAIWVASQDSTLFPAVLQQVDPKSGEPLSSYWSNGYVTSVTLARLGGRPLLLVGACNNETKGATLAVLNALSPNAVAPAENEPYRCTSCGGGFPEVFLVFPKPLRFAPLDVSSAVISIAVAGDRMTLTVAHGQSRAGLSANGVYTLDSAFRPVSVTAADEYVAAFGALVAEGAVPAPAPDGIDAEREFLPLKRWSASLKGYVAVPLTPDSR